MARTKKVTKEVYDEMRNFAAVVKEVLKPGKEELWKYCVDKFGISRTECRRIVESTNFELYEKEKNMMFKNWIVKQKEQAAFLQAPSEVEQIKKETLEAISEIEKLTEDFMRFHTHFIESVKRQLEKY